MDGTTRARVLIALLIGLVAGGCSLFEPERHPLVTPEPAKLVVDHGAPVAVETEAKTPQRASLLVATAPNVAVLELAREVTPARLGEITDARVEFRDADTAWLSYAHRRPDGVTGAGAAVVPIAWLERAITRARSAP